MSTVPKVKLLKLLSKHGLTGKEAVKAVDTITTFLDGRRIRWGGDPWVEDLNNEKATDRAEEAPT